MGYDLYQNYGKINLDVLFSTKDFSFLTFCIKTFILRHNTPFITFWNTGFKISRQFLCSGLNIAYVKLVHMHMIKWWKWSLQCEKEEWCGKDSRKDMNFLTSSLNKRQKPHWGWHFLKIWKCLPPWGVSLSLAETWC